MMILWERTQVTWRPGRISWLRTRWVLGSRVIFLCGDQAQVEDTDLGQVDPACIERDAAGVALNYARHPTRVHRGRNRAAADCLEGVPVVGVDGHRGVIFGDVKVQALPADVLGFGMVRIERARIDRDGRLLRLPRRAR